MTMRPREHIDDRTLVRLARGQIRGDEYEKLMEHIVHCDDCRFKYVALRKYVESKGRHFGIPYVVERVAYVLTGLVLFLLMNLFSHRANIDFAYGVPAQLASDTSSVVVENVPRIKYIYIDTLALHIFYLRGEKALFKFDFEPHGNVLKIKAKKPSP